MIFEELKQSISELSTEELHEQIRLMRQRRRARPTAKVTSRQVVLPTAAQNLDLARLIASMEEIIGGKTDATTDNKTD